MSRSTEPAPAPPRGAAARLSPPEVDLADTSRGPQTPRVWAGVVWSRLGRGDHAWAWWDTVDAPALQPWVAAERGRVLRELGLHGEAEAREAPAVATAEDPVDHAMLLVSLAADAVGHGDAEAARARYAGAARAVADLADHARAARQRLRLSWVRVEVAWTSGQEPTDVGLPRWADGARQPVLPADLAHGSGFHHAKALLFGGLVAHSLPLLDRAAACAPPALAWAVHLARADHGAPEAMEAAVAAWRAIVPPPAHAEAVRATPTARRLTAAG